MKWTPDMARAFVDFRKNDQHAYSYSIEVCFRTPDIMEAFAQWYGTQRLLGNRKPHPDDEAST